MDRVQLAQTKLREAEDLHKEYREAIDDITEGDVVALTLDFFIKNPSITSFTWDQYTPYFMDGAPCIFSVNTDYMRVTYLHGEAPEDANIFWGDEEKYEMSEENANLLRDFRRMPDDVFLNLFGDHVEVTISNLGEVTRADCNHD